MKKYDYIIFDADHTLIDFDADERRAFYAAFGAAGISASAETVEDCWRFSYMNWGSLGLNDVHLPEIRSAYHDLYNAHVRALFDYADTVYGLNGRRERAEEAFMSALRQPSHPIDGAEEVVRALAEGYRVCVATNGLACLQKGRLRGFEQYLYRVFISEELGTIKPDPLFFNAVLRELNAPAGRCLMVGDSLSSDIAGANDAGMDCVWFDRRRHAVLENVAVTARITDLRELLGLLQ